MTPTRDLRVTGFRVRSIVAFVAILTAACGPSPTPSPTPAPTSATTPAITPAAAALLQLTTVAKIPVPDAFEITAAFGSVWVGANGSGKVTRIDPATSTVVATIDVSSFSAGIVASDTAVWAVDGDAKAFRAIDPATNALTDVSIAIDDDGGDVQWAGGLLWHSYRDGSVRSFDPITGAGTDFVLPGGACDDCGFVIVGDAAYRTTPDSITRVDVATGKVTATNDTDTAGWLIGLGPTGLWMGAAAGGGVVLLDPTSLELLQHFSTQPALAADGSTWSLGASGENGSIVADEAGAWVRFSAPVLGHASVGGDGTVVLYGPFPTGWTGSSGFAVAFGSLWITNVSAGDVWRLDMPTS